MRSGVSRPVKAEHFAATVLWTASRHSRHSSCTYVV